MALSRLSLAFCILGLPLALGCFDKPDDDDDDSDGGADDTGWEGDGGSEDGGSGDDGWEDGGTEDGGTADGGSGDGGTGDGGTGDGGTGDGGTGDGGTGDGGTGDGGAGDGGGFGDGGTGDGGTGDGGGFGDGGGSGDGGSTGYSSWEGAEEFTYANGMPDPGDYNCIINWDTQSRDPVSPLSADCEECVFMFEVKYDMVDIEDDGTCSGGWDPSGTYGYSTDFMGYGGAWVFNYYGYYYWWGYGEFSRGEFTYIYGYIDYPYAGAYYSYYQYGVASIE